MRSLTPMAAANASKVENFERAEVRFVVENGGGTAQPAMPPFKAFDSLAA